MSYVYGHARRGLKHTSAPQGPARARMGVPCNPCTHPASDMSSRVKTTLLSLLSSRSATKAANSADCKAGVRYWHMRRRRKQRVRLVGSAVPHQKGRGAAFDRCKEGERWPRGELHPSQKCGRETNLRRKIRQKQATNIVQNVEQHNTSPLNQFAGHPKSCRSRSRCCRSMRYH